MGLKCSFKFGCLNLFSMSSLSNKSKADNVSVKTFLKWSFNNEFSYEVNSERDIASVTCKKCSLKWPEIEKEAKLRKYRGNVIQGFKNYALGCTTVHKCNLQKHIQSDVHAFAVKLLNLDTAIAGPSTALSEENVPAPTKKAHYVDSMILESSKTLHTILMNTALTIALEEMSFLKFKPLIEVQIRNGVKLSAGTQKLN